MLSIITAVHNQLEMNRLFYHYISLYADVNYELIIVDNLSTDGSREFFKSLDTPRVTVIENDGNYSYPHCQNQGIRAASYDTFAFLNNDILVPPAWSSRLLGCMKVNGLEVASPCGIEVMENRLIRRFYDKKWMWIKTALSVFGYTDLTLRLMVAFMYGNWERFSNRRYRRFGNAIIPGIAGHSVIMTRSAIEKVGPWDERIAGSDHDLLRRVALRNREHGDINLVHASLGVYHHHYVRLTSRSTGPYRPAPVEDHDKFISLAEKWGPAK